MRRVITRLLLRLARFLERVQQVDSRQFLSPFLFPFFLTVNRVAHYKFSLKQEISKSSLEPSEINKIISFPTSIKKFDQDIRLNPRFVLEDKIRGDIWPAISIRTNLPFSPTRRMESRTWRQERESSRHSRRRTRRINNYSCGFGVAVSQRTRPVTRLSPRLVLLITNAVVCPPPQLFFLLPLAHGVTDHPPSRGRSSSRIGPFFH